VPEKYAPDDLIEEFSMNNYCNKIHWWIAFYYIFGLYIYCTITNAFLTLIDNYIALKLIQLIWLNWFYEFTYFLHVINL
jgi:hypothetical protein